MSTKVKKAFKPAFSETIPILAGFTFLGLSYGILMNQAGFNFIYPLLCSLFIFGGSVEFLVVEMLLGSFSPLSAFITALIVNARHLFYGISMLNTFKNTGWKKFYLIFGMCDESFSIISSTDCPENVDKSWYMFFITLLNHFYWVFGATLGGLLGSVITIQIQGLDFVMTALFIVLFLNQFIKEKSHFSSYTGLVASMLCLFLFGGDNFIIPAMILILIFIIFKIKNGKEPIQYDT